jgi:acetyl-CoA C-acetyltransferase
MDGSTGVWILGGYQSDFARYLTKESREFASLTAEVVEGPVAAAKVDAAEIGVVHVGNAFGETTPRWAQTGVRDHGC